MILTMVVTATFAVPASAQDQSFEAIGLDGRLHVRPELPPAVAERLQEDLDKALANHSDQPTADTYIWLGRRYGYLGRYHEAIAVFSRGIDAYPEDARLYRHRGHRYISVRQLDHAINDLERAARLIRGENDQIEPDGAPNAFGIPRSTLHSNIWYHLGLAYYLHGEFEEALAAYRECAKVSRVNDDSRVAAAYWLVLILKRLDRQAEADDVLSNIRATMDVIENVAYHQLLLMFRGEVEPSTLLNDETGLAFATNAYGVAMWHRFNGEEQKADTLIQRILASGSWASFGFIAAEAETAAVR